MIARRQLREAPVFSLRYRVGGVRRWFRIGAHGEVSVEEARAIARRRLSEIANDRDPAEERRVVHAAALRTVDVVLDQFLARYAYNPDRPLRSADQYRDAFRRHVRPYIGALSIYKLMEDRAVVAGMLDRVEDAAGATTADRTLAYLRKALNWWQARDSKFRNPVVPGMSRTKPLDLARTRTLDEQELRDVWAALETAKVPEAYRLFIRTLAYTACRRSEAAGARWEEVVGNVWTIPAARSKTKLPHEVPLTRQAMEQFGPRHKSGFIFSTDHGLTSLSGFSKCKHALDTAVAELRQAKGQPTMPEWTQHDLRRTARTLLSRAGVDSDIAERCLGHLLPTVRRVYDQHEYFDAKLHAFERLAALVDRILNPVDEEVVALPTRRRRVE